MKTYYFHWSASEIMAVQFVRWQRKRWPRHHDGTCKLGWWGVGAVVYSKWAWRYPEARRSARKDRLALGQSWLAPHTELYMTYKSAVLHRGKTLTRPSLKQYAEALKHAKWLEMAQPVQAAQERIRELSGALRDWQQHAARMGKILGCAAITDDIERAARLHKKLVLELTRRGRQWRRLAQKYAE